MTSDFDPLAMENPFEFYRKARSENPVFFDRRSKFWVLTKYLDVRAVLADEHRFSAEADRESYSGLCPEAVAILQPMQFSKLYGLSTTENPVHDRIKRVALPLFNDLYLSCLKQKLQAVVDEYLDAFDPQENVDLVSAVCDPFPAAAICSLLGIPKSEVTTIKNWSNSRLMLTWGDPQEQVVHASNILKYFDYCKKLIAARMDEPADDLPSALGMAVRAGRLALSEVESFCYGLMFSGHATTSAFLAESIRVLLASNVWKELAATESSISTIGSTADEMLRLCPSAFTRRRRVLQDTTVGNIHIPMGSTLLLAIGSANRDESVFPDPDTVDLHRDNANQHLSFGHGFHYCIGSKVVKLEYTILLQQLARRFPQLSLSHSMPPNYQRNLSIRAPDSLFVSIRCFGASARAKYAIP